MRIEKPCSHCKGLGQKSINGRPRECRVCVGWGLTVFGRIARKANEAERSVTDARKKLADAEKELEAAEAAYQDGLTTQPKEVGV